MKKYISLFFCAILLVLGGALSGWAMMPPNIPAREYTVLQPSGETFKVQVAGESKLEPPFPSGTLLGMDISLKEEGDDPNLFPSGAHYEVYLAEDGYWYFAKCIEVVYRPSNDYEHPIVYREGDPVSYRDIREGHYEKIYGPSGPDAKVMIDPLPDEVDYISYYAGNQPGPFDLRKTTTKEKSVMAKLIEAERERLASLQTSTAIEDPGPDAFITESAEAESSGSGQTTTELSSTEVAVATSANETKPTGGDSAASISKEQSAAVQGQTSHRSWLAACLIAGGAIVVLAGVAVIAWRLRRRQNR